MTLQEMYSPLSRLLITKTIKMIQANELRIGNIIEVNQLGGGYYRVTGVCGLGIQVEGFDFWLLPERNNCVPLTPEILEKLGFNKDDNDYDYEHEDYCSWYEIDFPVIGKLITSSGKEYLFDEETDTLRIKYLHQLQNLYFALTGEELVINM